MFTIWYENWYLIEVCSWSSQWQYVNISRNNGLAQQQAQAITWTNDPPVHWSIYTSQGPIILTNIDNICMDKINYNLSKCEH